MLKRTFHRTVLALGLGALALPVLAQDAYPSRPIKLVVPYAAGGPADMLARMVGERLAPRLGQPVVVENKPGTGGHTGAEQVAKGPADGYTLVFGNSGPSATAGLMRTTRALTGRS